MTMIAIQTPSAALPHVARVSEKMARKGGAPLEQGAASVSFTALRDGLTRFSLLGTASFCAETGTHPMDFAKTRIQLQTESRMNLLGQPHFASPSAAKAHPPAFGFFGVLKNALTQEGLGSVYAALPPAVLRQLVYTTIRVSLYEELRFKLSPLFQWPPTSRVCQTSDAARTAATRGDDVAKKEGPLPLGAKVVAASTSGGIAQLVATPLDRVKVVLQRGGLARQQRGVWGTGAWIVQTEGWLGFHRGWAPSVQRAMLIQIGDMAAYDSAKDLVKGWTGWADGLAVQAAAAVISSPVACFLSTPADVMKSRMMADSAAYSSTLQCLKQTVASEGVLALWKGFLPTWARVGPWTFIFWTSYEQLRRVAGLEAF